MLQLRSQTPADWAQNALSNFDAFLLDHALCERKASAVGMSFIVRYPDRTYIIEPMIQFAREELEHFHSVCKLLLSRNLILKGDEPDEYVNTLQKACRHGRDERFLDRLVCASIIEARGFERLTLITKSLTDETLKTFYQRLTRAEGGHAKLFLRLAKHYFASQMIEDRLNFLLDVEARTIEQLPYRHALH